MVLFLRLRRLWATGAGKEGRGRLLRSVQAAAAEAGHAVSRMTVAPPGLHTRLLDELDSELQVLLQRRFSMIDTQLMRRLISVAGMRQVHPHAMRTPYVAEMAAEKRLATAVLDRSVAAGYPLQAAGSGYDLGLLCAALFAARDDRDKADLLERGAYE
jgi:hypothetical protein